jgi:hypothetical protein
MLITTCKTTCFVLIQYNVKITLKKIYINLKLKVNLQFAEVISNQKEFNVLFLVQTVYQGCQLQSVYIMIRKQTG